MRSGINYAIRQINKMPHLGFESCGGMLVGPCGRRHERCPATQDQKQEWPAFDKKEEEAHGSYSELGGHRRGFITRVSVILVQRGPNGRHGAQSRQSV